MATSVFIGLFLFALVAASTYFASKRYSLVLAILLFGLLFQELVIRILRNLSGLSAASISYISLWKEAVLAGLIITAIWKYADRWRAAFSKLGGFGFWSAVVLILWGITSVVISPDRLAGLAAFRDYFEPMVTLGLVLLVQPTEPQIRRYIIVWLAIGVVIAMLGIWQGALWGEQEYVRFGFGVPKAMTGIASTVLDGQVVFRPVSTVTGPNELGFHMLLLSIFSIKFMVIDSRKFRLSGGILFLLFSACLFYTRSRSDLIAYAISLPLVFLVSFKLSRSMSRQPSRTWWIAILVIVPLIIAGLFFTDMVPLVAKTIRNLKSEYHVVDISEAIAFLAKNPEGVGMGLAGPRIGAFFPETPAFHAEGSLFQVALDMGVFGLLLWLAFVLSMMSTIYRGIRSNEDVFTRAVRTTALIGWIGSLFVFIILPLMQSMTLMSWMWYFMGTALNPDAGDHPEAASK